MNTEIMNLSETVLKLASINPDFQNEMLEMLDKDGQEVILRLLAFRRMKNNPGYYEAIYTAKQKQFLKS